MQTKVNQSIVLLSDIDGSIFKNILTFIDSTSITNFVLTSRKIRKLIGSQLTSAQSVQKSYFKQKSEIQYKNKKIFDEYEEVINNSDVFANKKNYETFIAQLNIKNKNYFSNFFKAILNQEIKIENSTIQAHIEQFKSQKDEVNQVLQKLKQKPALPSLKIESLSFVDASVPLTNNILKFINKFVKNIKEIQAIKDSDSQLNQYFNNKKYLTVNKQITKYQYKGQYQNTLSYLDPKKTYHDFISFNQNSIIFSYLNTDDLRNLYNTDKKFSQQMPKLIPIIQANQFKDIKEVQEQPKDTKTYAQMENEILAGLQGLRKSDIDIIFSLKNPQEPVQLLMTQFFKLLQLNSNDTYIINIQKLKRSNFLQLLMSFNRESLTQKQIRQLDEYFKNNSLQQLQKVSLPSVNLYQFLSGLYRLRKFQLQQGQQSNKPSKMQQLKDDLIKFQLEIDANSNNNNQS